MLSVDDPRIEPLREQRKSALVTGLCGCGCASINLAVDRGGNRPAAICSQPISADPAVGGTAEANGMPNCGLLLFLDDGWLSLLEICWIAEPPSEFPPATTFGPPEVTCERHAGATAALDRESDGAAGAGTLGGALAGVRRLLHRRSTRDIGRR